MIAISSPLVRISEKALALADAVSRDGVDHGGLLTTATQRAADELRLAIHHEQSRHRADAPTGTDCAAACTHQAPAPQAGGGIENHHTPSEYIA